jgi:hypothetical protein
MTISKLTVATLGALAFVAAPAVAEHKATPTATEQCRDLRDSMDATFVSTFGTKKNAFGKCVAQRASATGQAKSDARENAAEQCKAEREATPADFAARNAFSKCVSTKAKAKTNKAIEDDLEAIENAAKQCVSERAADPASFKETHGTNESKSNAFGKCVSAKAKAQQDEQAAPPA